MGQVTCDRTGHYTEDYVDGTVKLRNKDWKAETKKGKRTIKTYHVFKSFNKCRISRQQCGMVSFNIRHTVEGNYLLYLS